MRLGVSMRLNLLWLILIVSTVHASDLPMRSAVERQGVSENVFEIGREYNIRPSDLKAIAWVETEHSMNTKWSEGNGREYGLYCINIKLHKLTKKQAQDPIAATRWVCRYLNKKGYQKDRR